MDEMFFPNTINKNTMKCYEIEKGFFCTESKIMCQNFGVWCRNLPKSLKELCIQSIAHNWEDYPKFDDLSSPEDKCMLLNILPTNLPLEITVPIIKDNIYWKKCALIRWPHLMPINISDRDMFIFKSLIGEREMCDDNKSDSEISISNVESISAMDELFNERISWKQYYLENHMKEYLETLEPDEYDPEQMKRICDICGPFVKTLKIEELRITLNGGSTTRIPMGSVLTGLTKLKELTICFKQKYIGFDNFNWKVLQLAIRDIQSLANGLEKINLRVLRIINSGIEGNQCSPILKSVRKYDNLKILDFSYCNLDEQGTISICQFVKDMNVTELLLADNNIGEEGAEAISFILHRNECTLEYLNLKMNPIGSKGGNLILKSLLRNKSLKILDLSACNIRVREIIAEVICTCSTLQELRLSNNPIGNEIDNIILKSMNINKSLRKIDLRMCSIHSDLHQKINDKLKEVPRTEAYDFVEEKRLDIEFSSKCRKYFENEIP